MIKHHFICVLMAILFFAKHDSLFAQGQYTEINNFSMYYEIHGKGEPILLIHGGLGSIGNFSNQIKAFSDSFSVIAPDSRGQGRSTGADSKITYEQMTLDVLALLDYLEIEKTHIVGYSDGGIIGLILAIKYPERVKKLIIVGTNFSPGGLTPETIEIIKEAQPGSWPETVNGYKSISPNPDLWSILFNSIKNMWLTSPNISTKELSLIKASTLIVCGDRDDIKFDHTAELFNSIPNAQLFIVPGATHFVMDEKSELFNEVVLSFLRK